MKKLDLQINRTESLGKHPENPDGKKTAKALEAQAEDVVQKRVDLVEFEKCCELSF